MCTLTIVKSLHETIVTMNRDERLARAESDPTIRRSSCGAQLWYPIDRVSGGSWFGVNQHGLVAALLNRYQASWQSGVLSRGEIVPLVLQCMSLSVVEKWLKQIDWQHYSSLNLVVFQNGCLINAQWDGIKLQYRRVQFEHPFFLSSSAVDGEPVTSWRRQLFNRWLAKGAKITAPGCLDFHLCENEMEPAKGIFMRRRDAHTKSISQAVIGVESIEARYWRREDIESKVAPVARDTISWPLVPASLSAECSE